MSGQVLTEAYAKTAKALIADLDLPSEDVTNRSGIHKELLLQPQASNAQHQLTHQLCHLITSGVPKTARALTTALRDDIEALLSKEDETPPQQFKNVVLFVLCARSFASDWLPEAQVAALHKRWFTRFGVQDLALPYSTMFNEPAFGANREELLSRYLQNGELILPTDVTPRHSLLIAWLSGANVFGPGGLSDYLKSADLSHEDDLKAARSLAKRFGKTGDALPPALAGIIGAGLGAVNLRDEKLYSKPSQARAAAKNRAVASLPFLAPLQRKPKVALCLSGQLRGYEATLASWRDRLFPQIEPSIHIHSWQEIGRSGAQPFRQVLPFEGKAFAEAYRSVATALGFDEVQQKYPQLFAKLAEGGRISEETLREVYKTDSVVLENDKHERFDNFSNQHKMHYKIHAADQLARNGVDADLFMRIRPDLPIKDVGFDWARVLRLCKSGPLILAEKGFGVHYGRLMIGDQCGLATPETMALYANTWETAPSLAEQGLAQFPETFTGHISLAMTCWYSGATVDRLPMRFGTLNEARPLSNADCLAALKADDHGDPQSKALINALQADLSN